MAVKWGFVGAGRITRRFLNGLIQVPDAETYAVYGRTPARAEALAADYGFKHVYSSVDELINSGIDVAYIATTHPSHAEFSKRFLEAKIPVLCEKPITPNAAATKDLIDFAKKHDTFLMEALWTRTFPVVLQIKEWLAEKKIGEVVGISGNFCIKATTDIEDRALNMNDGGGSVLDIGVYLLAFVESVLGGKADEIKALGLLGENGADLGASVALRYGDKLVSILMSFRSAGNDYLNIYGEEGSIEVDNIFWKPRKATLINSNGSITIESPVPDGTEKIKDFSFTGEGYQNEVKHVHECLALGLKESPLMPFDSTLALAEMMDEIRKQIGVVYPFEK